MWVFPVSDAVFKIDALAHCALANIAAAHGWTTDALFARPAHPKRLVIDAVKDPRVGAVRAEAIAGCAPIEPLEVFVALGVLPAQSRFLVAQVLKWSVNVHS